MIDVPPEFLAFLKEEEARAEDVVTDERRRLALEFYNGEPFGDEEEGRSQLVTRDVAEVVDYMTVSILRTCVSGDRVVEFEGRSAAQGEYADDATEVIQQQFLRRQDGYRLIHDWIKAGLLEITGIVKTYVEKQPPLRVHHKLPDVLLGEVDPVEATPLEEHDEVGNQIWHVVTHQEQGPKFCDSSIPNEEFRCAPDARDLDDAVYMAHVPPKTISDLVKMGFDAADADLLPQGSTLPGTIAFARDGDRDTNAPRYGANQRVNYREEHVLYDLDGDGVAERLMVHRVEDHILAVSEEDDHPFEEWCPFPMQNRRIGQALAEKVMDIQRTRSVLLRQAMDNLYLSNNPRQSVSEDALGVNTIDDLLTVRPGAIIRYKGASEPKPYSVPFVAGETFQALEMFVGERESRTGITRLNQGLDADALNKTATGTALMQASGQQMEEYLARNFAEALGRLFQKKLKLQRQYGAPISLRVDGVFKTVDPKKWDSEMDLTIRVGLGSGRKEQRLLYRQQIGEMMQQFVMSQNFATLVTPTNAYNLAAGAVKDMGLGNPNDYFTDPASPQGQRLAAQAGQPKPDPKMAEVQGKLQIEQQRAQGHLALKAQEVQAKQASDAAAAQTDQASAAASADTERQKMLGLLDIQQVRANTEAQQNAQRMGMDYVLEQQKIAAAQRTGQAKIDAQVHIAANRPGGSLDE